VELFEGILGDLKKEARADKDQLVQALSEALTRHGMPQKSAHQASKDIARDNKRFLSFYSSQVIGLNPDELGSPWRAAYSSFLLFAAGSLVPLTTWLFMDGLAAVIISIVLTAVASVFVGGFVAYSSGKRVVYGALRQLLIVLGSAIVVYAIGHVFGVTVA
jgi:VIT1/CCC1 family predicted Fe2+/Mn2+ transporter